MTDTQSIDPPIFADVPTGTDHPHACTPGLPLDPRWYGIVIQAPKRVALRPGKPLWIPVCAEHLLPTLKRTGAPPRVVARSRETGAVHAGDYIPAPPTLDVNGWLLDPIPNDPVHPDKRQALEGHAVAVDVNIDVAAVAKLPLRAASYEIHMELDGYRSNTVVVEVVDGPLQ